MHDIFLMITWPCEPQHRASLELAFPRLASAHHTVPDAWRGLAHSPDLSMISRLPPPPLHAEVGAAVSPSRQHASPSCSVLSRGRTKVSLCALFNEELGPLLMLGLMLRCSSMQWPLPMLCVLSFGLHQDPESESWPEHTCCRDV